MDLETLVAELKRMTLAKDMASVEATLEKLAITENFDDAELKQPFIELLMHNTPNINFLVVKTIAEATKSPGQRTKFTNNEILEKLNELLGIILLNSRDCKNHELLIQLCRALGNIFYSNDDARNIIFHLDGGKVLVALFDVSASDIKVGSQHETFAKVRSGVISNYLLGNEELSQKVISLGIIGKMKTRLEEAQHEESSEGLEFLLTPFSILTEQVSDLIFEPEIIKLITKILKKTKSSEVADSSLELLMCQAENDDIKFLLAKEGLCEHILDSFSKYETVGGNSETKSIVKLSCDFIVLILTGDEAMQYLYNHTHLCKSMKKWMESEDMDVMTTSVLAIGNFARTDDHCIKMVSDGMHLKLIEILAKNNGPETDVRLQHALLSAIRNLVIPKQNKDAVIKAGLIATILPMLEIHQPPVVFKLLGTLRMLVDEQEALALELLNNTELLTQLVEWARKTPDMIGVNSESSRLMASLIKNAYRSRVSEKVVETDPLKGFVEIEGTVEALVKMLLSAHLVMQNEALIGLTLIVAYLSDETSVSETLISCSLGPTLTLVCERMSEMERTSNEIVENLNTLVSRCSKSNELRGHLSEHNIDEKLKAVPRIKELATL